MKKSLILAIVAILVIGGIYYSLRDSGNKENTSSEQTVIKAGYIIYPPLMTRDETTGQLSGVSYDIAEAVAKEIGAKIEWTEEVGWGTALEGLNTNRYDVLGTQMWPNEAREKVANFSVAPMNSVIYPYTKTGDTRFSADNLKAINSPEYTISALDGEMTVFIAQEDYPNAKLNSLPQLSSYAEVFLNVVQNKADITFVEPSAAEDFLASNPDSITRLGNTPVRSFGNGFAFDKSDAELRTQWNAALNKLIADGTIESILEKHGVASHYQINK
jgi:polar amino acid transport system substrate-binding protein